MGRAKWKNTGFHGLDVGQGTGTQYKIGPHQLCMGLPISRVLTPVSHLFYAIYKGPIRPSRPFITGRALVPQFRVTSMFHGWADRFDSLLVEVLPMISSSAHRPSAGSRALIEKDTAILQSMIPLPWKSNHHFLIGRFPNHHYFSRGLSSSKRNHHF